MTTEEWQQIAEQEVARPIACEILNTCACTRAGRLLGIASEIGHDTDSAAAMLAVAAWVVCSRRKGWRHGRSGSNLYYLICAEAESLLQRGWLPGGRLEGY